MSRGPPLQPQLSKLAESSIPAEEEIANGGGQVDDAMEEDVEQEGYGEFQPSRVSCPNSSASQLQLHSIDDTMYSFFNTNVIIDVDKLVLRSTRT